VVGTGIAVCIDYATDHSELTRTQAQLAMAVPLAIFLISLWSFHDLTEAFTSLRRLSTPIAALLVMGSAWFPYAPIWMAIILIVLAIARERRHNHFEVTSH